jgi:hypothetical protein
MRSSFSALSPQGHHQMVRVCNECFLSVHDSEQIHEHDDRVPVGFICYVPYGPPYMTGPGGLGDLRDIGAKPDRLRDDISVRSSAGEFRSARIMPRARSVVVKRVELSHKAKGPVFVLLVSGGTVGGTTAPSVAAASTTAVTSSGSTTPSPSPSAPSATISTASTGSSPIRPGAKWVVRRLFTHFQHLCKYFGAPDDEIPRNGPTTGEAYAIETYSDIMVDYLNEWLSTYDTKSSSKNLANTQSLVDRLQHFLTADASLLSTRTNRNRHSINSRGVGASAGASASASGVSAVDVLERIQPRESKLLNVTLTKNSKSTLSMEVDEIVHVTHAEVVTWRWDPHVQYVIRTRASSNPSILYVTRRRARFFHILHNQLKKMGFKDLPTLPGTKGINLSKIISGKTFDCAAVQVKRLAYEQYMRDLVSRPEIRTSSELNTFLGCIPCSELDQNGAPSSTRSSRSSSSMSEMSTDLMVSGSGVSTKQQQLQQQEVQNLERATKSITEIKHQIHHHNDDDDDGGMHGTCIIKPHQKFSSIYIATLIMEIATLKSKLQTAEDKIAVLEGIHAAHHDDMQRNTTVLES